jgi:hypothetical protein
VFECSAGAGRSGEIVTIFQSDTLTPQLAKFAAQGKVLPKGWQDK